MDPNYVPVQPSRREKLTAPGLVFFRDNSSKLVWTVGQHARSLMESLRISLFELQSGKEVGLEEFARGKAVETWPRLRGIFFADNIQEQGIST